MQTIVTLPPKDRVGICIAQNRVIASFTTQRIVAALTTYSVVTSTTSNGVSTRQRVKFSIALIALQFPQNLMCLSNPHRCLVAQPRGPQLRWNHHPSLQLQTHQQAKKAIPIDGCCA